MDSTKVNNVQENLLEAIKIVSEQSLKKVSFDKTITCTITNNENKKEGKYTVSDGSRTFMAYSSDTSYKVDDVVFVTIPASDSSNKIIIGKKTATEDAAYVVEEPFDGLFALTENLVDETHRGEYGLTANWGEENKGDDFITIGTWDVSDQELIGYSRLGVKAEFKTLIKDAAKGNYGLQLNIVYEDGTDQTVQLTSAEMFGNPYNFESYYEQQEVVDINNIEGQIKTITATFYQKRDFYNKATRYLDCTNNGYKQDNEYFEILDDLGYRIPRGEQNANNIFIKNLFICVGEDIDKFNSDFVDLYTKDKKSYKENETKTVKMRWVHVDKTAGTKTDILAAVKNESLPKDDKYEIRWYRYLIGAEAADEYSSVYWYRIDPKTGERVFLSKGIETDAYDVEYSKIKEDWDNILEELKNDDASLDEKEKERRKETINKNYQEQLEVLQEEYNAKDYWYTDTVDKLDLDLQSFTCTITPNNLKNTEKIKAIAFYNDVAYRPQQEIVFTNEKEVYDQSTAVFLSALQIDAVDGSNGNYLLYGQDASLRDSEESKKIRTLQAYFDTNSDGTAESLIQPGENLVWIFPTDSTMINVIDETVKEYNRISLTSNDWISGQYYYQGYEKITTLTSETWESGQYYYLNEENEYELDTSEMIIEDREYYQKNYILDTEEIITADRQYYQLVDTGEIKDKTINPSYTINRTYSSSRANNTVICRYTLEGSVYETEKEFTFGAKGTMGSDQTIVIDFVGDNNAITDGDGESSYELKVQLYNEDNQLANDVSENITWGWFYQSTENLTLDNNTINNQVVRIEKGTDFTIDEIHIIQVTVGKLTTYFPLPIKQLGYNYINGPSQVIYKADGSADYSKDIYSVVGASSLNPDWRIRVNLNENNEIYRVLPYGTVYKQTDDDTWEEVESPKDFRYIGSLQWNSTYYGYQLQPLSIYVEGSPVYAVQAYIGDYIMWTQPILVLQNKWASNVINQWDGKSLVLDEKNSNIIASSIAAGKKNSDDNTFSGVMLGDWSDTDTGSEIAKQTGVYGFHHGAMSYAFKEDGTAFLGKDGAGRINFDGNEAVIKSATYELNGNGQSTGTKRTIGEMKIDLNQPSIIMKYGNNSISIDASKAGSISSDDSTSAPFQIGSNFAVDWDGTLYANNGHFIGEITGDYGSIGNWIIEDPTATGEINSITKGGTLHNKKKDGTASIILNPNGDGSIVLGSTTGNRIVIDASGNGTINMGDNSIIYGGIIEAGTLSSIENSTDIRLRGYLKVQLPEKKISNDGNTIIEYKDGGCLGYFESNLNSSTTSSGVGFCYGNRTEPTSVVKATSANVGLSYDTSNYLTISSNEAQMEIEEKSGLVLNSKETLLYGAENKEYEGVTIEQPYCGFEYNSEGYWSFSITNVSADHQTGIYARFA